MWGGGRGGGGEGRGGGNVPAGNTQTLEVFFAFCENWSRRSEHESGCSVLHPPSNHGGRSCVKCGRDI